MSADKDFEQKLAAVVERECAPFQLTSVNQLTAGASQQTFRLSIKGKSGEETNLAFRRAQPGLESSTYNQLAPSLEVELLRLAAASSVPVPAIQYVLKPSDELGDGYIMEWLSGETLGQRIVKLPELAGTRASLAYDCGQALARIHAIDLPELVAGKLQTVLPEQLVRETWEAYIALNTPQPMIDFTAQWLLSNLPDTKRSTLVHGDFRNGNLMVDKTGIRAVLDWELCHIGDPVRDLGWLCVNSWRFGRRHLPVGGFGHVDDLIAGYERLSGEVVDRSALTFWEVFGSFWWSVTTLGMANTWRTGETPSLERPVIGRRSSEAQMDCVNLVIPGDVNRLGPSVDTGNLPFGSELVSSVRSYLNESILPGASGSDKFLVRVAMNSLAIAERELKFGMSAESAELGGLQALLEPGDLESLRWKLVHAIRAGDRLPKAALHAHLRRTVTHRLEIDQPTYSALAVASSDGSSTFD